jgi:hypothetical protein
MATMLAGVMYAVDALERTVGADVLVSLAALAVIVLFLYVEGRSPSRPSH